MPRSMWNGTVSVGVVHVPVKLYSATESKTVHFHEVHLEDEAGIEHKRFCAKEDREVPYLIDPALPWRRAPSLGCEAGPRRRPAAKP
jgi:hypothetical protein